MHINKSFYIKINQKNGLKIDEFYAHQTPPNLKFCLSSSKEKKDLFVLKQNDIFLFCFSVATNLIEILEIAFFSVYSASSPDQG